MLLQQSFNKIKMNWQNYCRGKTISRNKKLKIMKMVLEKAQIKDAVIQS